MPMTLAGLELRLPTPELRDWIGANIPQEEACPWVRNRYPTGKAGQMGLVADNWVRRGETPVVPGRLRWPQGASRWAYGHFLCASSDLEGIRLKAWGDSGTELKPVTLSIWSDVKLPPGEEPEEGAVDAGKVEPEMFVIHWTPLSCLKRSDVEGLHLLTLVDRRYFWWSYRVPDFRSSSGEIAGGSSDWASFMNGLLEQPLEDMGGSFSDSSTTIDSETHWLYPGPSFWCEAMGDPIPHWLDAAAAHVGRRFVAMLDGTHYKLQTVDQADKVHGTGDPSKYVRFRTRRAGGHRFPENAWEV